MRTTTATQKKPKKKQKQKKKNENKKNNNNVEKQKKTKKQTNHVIIKICAHFNKLAPNISTDFSVKSIAAALQGKKGKHPPCIKNR